MGPGPIGSTAICNKLFQAGAGLSGSVDDAESLMRSRYSAYARGLEDYLLATWHPSTRPGPLDLGAAPQPKWLGLEIKACSERGDAATVEFVARCRIGGRARRLHEVSRFLRENGRWYYVDGVID